MALSCAMRARECGTAERERRTTPSVGASFERTSGSRREVECVVRRRSRGGDAEGIPVALAATVASATGAARSVTDESEAGLPLGGERRTERP